MTGSLLAQLQTPEARRAVGEAVRSLLERWALHETRQAELLGVADMSDITRTGLLPNEAAVLERAGHLLAIDRALKRLHADQSVADWWVRSPCEAFGGFSPLTVMLSGVEGIERVRTYLEAQLKAAG